MPVGMRMVLAAVSVWSALASAAAESAGPDVPTLAILGFQPGTALAATDAAILDDLLFVRLGGLPDVALVERALMARIRQERELWGLAGPELAATLSRELGAELILLGRVLSRDTQRSYLAQFVSCQTGSQAGVTVRLPAAAPLPEVADRLCEALAAALQESRLRLLPARRPVADQAAEISAGRRRETFPTVWTHLELATDAEPENSPEPRVQEWLLAAGFVGATTAAAAGASVRLDVAATAETTLGEKVAVRAEARGDVTVKHPGSTATVQAQVLRVGRGYQATRRRALDALVDQVMPQVLRTLVPTVEGLSAAAGAEGKAAP